MKTRRNDPCPCGSGRKYKRCCGSSALADASVEDLLLAALVELQRFSQREEFHEDHVIGSRIFWGDLIDGWSPEMVADLLEEEVVAQQFTNFVTLDLDVQGGATILDLMIERGRGALSEAAMGIYRALSKTVVAPFLVVDEQAGSPRSLKNLWDESTVEVAPNEALSPVQNGDVIAARVLHIEGQSARIVGEPYRFASHCGPVLVKRLRIEQEQGRFVSDQAFLKRCGFRFHAMWLELELGLAASDPPQPKKVEFEVKDGSALRTALESNAELSAWNGGWRSEAFGPSDVALWLRLVDDRLIAIALNDVDSTIEAVLAMAPGALALDRQEELDSASLASFASATSPT